MKVAETVCVETAVPHPCVESIAARSRLADYVELTKPRIGLMVLFTVAAGYFLGAAEPRAGVLFHALFGTALVASGASALNQWLERRTDGRMRRTMNRPLPAGRLQPWEVFAFGTALGVVGVAYLILTLPEPTAALVAAFTFVSYVAVYTPMKTRTPLNTLVGAVPGAMPPVIGWCAARGSIGAEAVALFAMLFFWQLPHFYAIAWMYRDEYARAGLKMVSGNDPTGRRTARWMLATCLLLVPAGVAPAVVGSASVVYAAGALALGGFFLARVLRFCGSRTHGDARSVLLASLVYLPGLLGLLLIDSTAARLMGL
jgi:protoheme IX farnesyltransferase